jgi:hypothetical protein
MISDAASCASIQSAGGVPRSLCSALPYPTQGFRQPDAWVLKAPGVRNSGKYLAVQHLGQMTQSRQRECKKTGRSNSFPWITCQVAQLQTARAQHVFTAYVTVYRLPVAHRPVQNPQVSSEPWTPTFIATTLTYTACSYVKPGVTGSSKTAWTLHVSSTCRHLVAATRSLQHSLRQALTTAAVLVILISIIIKLLAWLKFYLSLGLRLTLLLKYHTSECDLLSKVHFRFINSL